MLDKLKDDVKHIGKQNWRDMLLYVAQLHEKNINKPRNPIPNEWEGIGPGYCYGPAFGHWDIVHVVIDVLDSEPLHAKTQLLNNLSAQQDDGLIPGAIFFWNNRDAFWNKNVSHPPLWPVAVSDYCNKTGSNELIEQSYEPLLKLIGWFENNRTTTDGAFYYDDILNHSWESGIDHGVRFDYITNSSYACVDATSHVYWLYKFAENWSRLLGKDSITYSNKVLNLNKYLQEELFDEETGFFYDKAAILSPEKRHLCFEGMWPMVVGAATQEQANRVIDENLLNSKRFNTTHPIASVGINDSSFELRMWRGPAFNSMTYWAARGCIGYKRFDAAKILLEKALDSSALQYSNTGTIWEFYHPNGADPKETIRKPETEFNTPCSDYLGHNPLIEMARLWQSIQDYNNHGGM